MDENSIGKEIVDAAIAVHRELDLADANAWSLKRISMEGELSWKWLIQKAGITRTVNGLPEKILGDLGGLAGENLDSHQSMGHLEAACGFLLHRLPNGKPVLQRTWLG